MKKLIILFLIIVSVKSFGQNDFQGKNIFRDSMLIHKQAQYAANYGSTFNIRSLVDKGYVDSSVTANVGGITLAAIGSSPNANGASLSSGTFNLQPASGSFGGVVTTGAQTFAGAKTFSTTPIFSAETAGRALYTTTSGQVATSGSFLYDNSVIRLAIQKANDINEAILVNGNAGSNLTNILLFDDNNSSGEVKITDAATSGFLPMISLKPDGTTANYSLIRSQVNDAGSEAATTFRVTNYAGSGTLSTKDLFDWQNYTTSLMKLKANGQLRLSNYGTGTSLTGTPFKYTAVESDGDVIAADAVSNFSFSDGNGLVGSVSNATTTPQLSVGFINDASSTEKRVVIHNGTAYQQTAKAIPDADYTIGSTDYYILLPDPSTTRTLTLGAASSFKGKHLIIDCRSTSTGEWMLSGSFLQAGTVGTYTEDFVNSGLVTGKIYELMSIEVSTGTWKWVQIRPL